MELQDLKSGWQNAGATLKTEADLLNMTKITRHPTLKNIRVKLIAETILLLLFLAIYYNWFDGDKKPFYANAVLITGVLLYIATDVIGYIALLKPISGVNLKISLENYLTRIKQLSIYALLFSLTYAISLIVFFASVINFTREKRFILLGAVIVLVQAMLWSRRIWFKWIKNLKQQVKDLN